MLGQCWRSAGRPAWDILAPFPSFQSRLSRPLLEQSASHSPAEVAALEAPARLGGVLLPGVSPASSRALPVSS